ncbi:MAG TPA: hypothetical protein VD735_06200, partial [Candidatus Saccharimonadales bacterium]|nr:hypothetical protein [Candidatus Saccharimonadales bacterium]
GAGPVKTTIRQHTSNIVAVRFGGHAQTLEEFSVDFNTNQPAANTNATAFECYNTFFSTYRKLFAFRCARGFQLGTNNSIITAQGGMNGAFSCHFDTLEINGYSISAIDFTSTNGYSTGNVWSNVYTHNNYTGTTVANAGPCVKFAFCDEQVIHQLNIEHSNPAAPALFLQQAKNVAIDSLHFEGLTPSTWGDAFISLYDACKLMVRGVTFSHNTVPANLGPYAAFYIGGGNCYLNCSGLNRNTNTISNSGTNHVLVHYESAPTTGTVAITEAELGDYAATAVNDSLPSNIKNLNYT